MPHIEIDEFTAFDQEAEEDRSYTRHTIVCASLAEAETVLRDWRAMQTLRRERFVVESVVDQERRKGWMVYPPGVYADDVADAIRAASKLRDEADR